MIAQGPAGSRDTAGFVYRRDGILLRQVNASYAAAFDQVAASGCFEELAGAGLLVPHEIAPQEMAATDHAHRILRPEPLPFVSYPYEWSFGQLRAAALLTLEIQRRALQRGVTLRDASAYNVQFRGTRPVFIDTLSLGPYAEGAPWVAYRQFCEHFLAPLALMAHRDVRLGRLHADFADGVPLDLASRMLGAMSWRRPSLLLHVHLHARAQRRWADASSRGGNAARGVGRAALLRLVEQLEQTVESLRWDPAGTTWADYEQTHGYSVEGSASKERAVAELLAMVAPRTTWDLGANTGRFSRIAAGMGSEVVSIDGDPAAVERAYRDLGRDGSSNVLPLLVDLLAPSARGGWAGEERQSLADRGPSGMVLALALIHHLAFSGNIALPRIARWFAELGEHAIVEFVPFDDPQVRRLVAARTEATHGYDVASFEAAFAQWFTTVARRPLQETGRVLYLFRRNAAVAR